MQNAANWRFRGPITNLISTRPESGGQDRSFQLIVIGVITGEGDRGRGRRLDRRGKKGDGMEWLLFVTFIVLEDHNFDGRGRKYFAALYALLLPSTIRDVEDKTSSFRCMHPNRIGERSKESESRTAHVWNSIMAENIKDRK